MLRVRRVAGFFDTYLSQPLNDELSADRRVSGDARGVEPGQRVSNRVRGVAMSPVAKGMFELVEERTRGRRRPDAAPHQVLGAGGRSVHRNGRDTCQRRCIGRRQKRNAEPVVGSARPSDGRRQPRTRHRGQAPPPRTPDRPARDPACLPGSRRTRRRRSGASVGRARRGERIGAPFAAALALHQEVTANVAGQLGWTPSHVDAVRELSEKTAR